MLGPRSAPALALALALGVAACSNPEADTPTACIAGPKVIERALERAPGPARLQGRIPISDCIVPDQKVGQMTAFGSAAVEVANRLGRDARKPGVEGIAAAIRAGYLVGAVERGAADTGGIHAALLDRIRSAATNGVTGSALSHYEIGYEAGKKLG